MALKVCMAMLIILTNILMGCRSFDEEPRTPSDDGLEVPHTPPRATETDLVEELMRTRKAYQRSLERIVDYYTETGSKIKLQWARKELDALKSTCPNPVPRLAPDHYKATNSIPAADNLFRDAQALEKSIGVISETRYNNRDKLRLAVQKYEQLIGEYPTSDKIDDAAFHAGLILEEFRDYMVSLDYCRNAFKWNPETPYPARFKAAYILDKHMHRYDEALKLYQEALKTEAKHDKHKQWKEFAEQRIKEIRELEEDKSM